jgi:hypothetical protein
MRGAELMHCCAEIRLSNVIALAHTYHVYSNNDFTNNDTIIQSAGIAINYPDTVGNC